MSIREPDVPAYLDYISHLAREAGEILKHYFVNRNFSSRQKEGVDFTTEADLRADEFIREGLLRQFPYPLLTEETAPKDFNNLANEEALWVVDPLDGTINFSRGCPNFAVSIALLRKGQPVFGLVYAPMSDELFWASEGVPLSVRNGKPIKVSTTEEPREAVIACDWAWGLDRRREVVRCIDRICGHVRQIKCMGSAVADLALLATGGIDVYFHAGLKPWDMAAPAIILEKAGGVITDLEGDSWNPFVDNILAGSPVMHRKILELVRGDGN